MSKTVYHFYRSCSKESSRISSQLEIDKGFCLDNMNLIDISTVINIFKKASKGDIFIFHQQSSLINLLICDILSNLIKKVNIVYDIHDVLEYKKGLGLKNKIRFVFLYIAEYIVFSRGKRILTVSDGLANIYLKRFRRLPLVFYNIPQLSSLDISTPKLPERKDYIYFGQINNTRLSIELLEIFKSKNKSIDVYGFFNNECDKDYYESFKAYQDQGIICYKGKYTPKTIHQIVSQYKYSLIFFDSENLNLRYCLPNKLFQTLEAGTICIISENLYEIIDKFNETGMTITLSESFENNHDLMNEPILTARNIIKSMRLKSYENYKSILR